MKKIYSKPTMNVVRIQQVGIICHSVTSTSTNLGDDDTFNFGGGGSGPAKARSHSVWDDDWDEE